MPLGIQALAQTFNYSLGLSIFPNLKDALKSFDSPATKQMLKYRLINATDPFGEYPLNPDYITFINELETLNDCNGFPTKCRNIAVALGSWNGTGQRSNIDLNKDQINDLQHSSFPILFINYPRGGTSDEPKAIWELNTCEALATFVFQIQISTAFSYNYPYYNSRKDYGGLDNWAYATFLYNNFSGNPLFPTGVWDRVWWYKNNDPMDFAPGSFVPSYDQILSAINTSASGSTEVECSYGYAPVGLSVPKMIL